MRRLILACCLLLCLPLQAEQRIVLSASQDSVAVRAFTAALAQRRPQDQVSFMPLDSLRQAPEGTATHLVSLDAEVLRWRLAQPGGPATLAMRISRVEGHALFGERPHPGITLLWSDPPAARQLRLARLLLPGARRVGLLYDEQSAFLVEEYRQAAQALQLELDARAWSPGGNRRPLLALLENNDLLLGLDAPRLYNAQTIKSLLLTSYAQQRPLLGPTAGFVRAGSLASSYSDQQDWLETLDRLLAQPPSSWPEAAYPSHFKVVSNRQVARALGLAAPADAELTRQLSEGETP